MFNIHRKKMFVSGRIQGRLMTRIALYWVLYHVVLWHALLVFRYIDLRISGRMAATPTPFGELYRQFTADYYPLILCALIALPIVIVDMLQMTHRIAGPLVRFQGALRDLRAGKWIKPVELRKGDLLTEFQDEFNAYLETVQQPGTDPAADEPAMSETDAQTITQVTEAGEKSGEVLPAETASANTGS